MDKVFMFLLVVLLLALTGSLAVIAVCVAVDFVKDTVDGWRE